MKRILLLVWFFLSFFHETWCLVVGSNTAASRQALITFPQADSDNEMRGFAAFEAGFTLTDGSTVCLFNSLMPVSGMLTFNDGTLTLNKNMVLSSGATIANGGTIAGQGYTLELPDKISAFSLPAMTMGNITLNLNSNVTLSGAITFTGTCEIEGRGYILDCGASGAIRVGSGATLTMNHLIVDGVAGTNISCQNTAATIALDDVVWVIDSNYSFTQGRFNILGDWSVTGTNIFTYSSDQTSTLGAHAQWLFDSGMTFSYASSIRTALNMENSLSVLYLYEAALYSVAPGLRLTKGTLIIDGTCPVISAATVQADGIELGDGASALNNIDVKNLPESGLEIQSGFLVHKNV